MNLGFPPLTKPVFSKENVEARNRIIMGNYFKGANLGYKPLITGFVNSINGNGEIPIPVEHAIMTNTVLEAAMISIREGRPVYLKELSGSSNDK